MTAEQLLDSLARRGHTIRMHPKGGFMIVPSLVLTDDERTALKDTRHHREMGRSSVRDREPSPRAGMYFCAAHCY